MMIDTHVFYLETMLGDNNWREDSYEVTVQEFSPFSPGRYSGRAEDCYPDEGGVAYGGEPVIHREGSKGKGIEITWKEFLTRWSSYHGLTDDSLNQRYPKTALDKAEDDVNGVLYDECEAQRQVALEEADEARYDEWRDEQRYVDWKE